MRNLLLPALLTAALSAQAAPAPAAARHGLQELHSLEFGRQPLPPVRITPHGSSLRRLCFPRDGKRLFVAMDGGRDGETFAVDIATGAVTRLASAGWCLGALQHGPLLFTGSSIEAPEDPDRPPVLVPARSDVFLSPFGDVAVITSAGTLGLVTQRVDLATGAKVMLRLGNCFAAGVAYSADGQLAIACGQAAEGGRVAIESIRVFDQAGRQLADVKVADTDARVLSFTNDGSGVVFVDDRLRIVEAASGALRIAVDERPVCWLPLGTSAALSHDGERVALRDAATLVRAKEFPLDLPEPEVVGGKARSPRLLHTAASPDGTLLAVAGPTRLKVFRITGGGNSR